MGKLCVCCFVCGNECGMWLWLSKRVVDCCSGLLDLRSSVLLPSVEGEVVREVACSEGVVAALLLEALEAFEP